MIDDEALIVVSPIAGGDNGSAVGESAVASATNVPSALPQGRAKRTLTWWRLGMITFVFTCSGPGGLEQVVKAGGPLLALVGIFVMPVVYVVPQVVVVAELASMMPTNAGCVWWVYRGFGRFAGFYSAWTCAISNMVDCAGYPLFIVEYISSSYYTDMPFWSVKVPLRLGFLAFGTAASLASTKDLSNVATAGFAVTVVIIVTVFFRSTPNIRPAAQWAYINDVASLDYSLLGSSLLWMYTGWATLGSLAGEVTGTRVLYQGMTAALSLDVFVYTTALLASLTVAEAGLWDAGYISVCFNRVLVGIGPYFGAAVIFSSCILFVSVLVCYSRSLWGMASLGWIPRIFTKELSTGAPHVAVFAHVFVAVCLMWFDFSFIVQVEYTLSAASDIMMDASFLRLRYIDAAAERPYRVPGGKAVAWIITLLKVLVVGGTCVAGLLQWRVLVAFLGVNVGVCLGYAGLRYYQPQQPLPSTLTGSPNRSIGDGDEVEEGQVSDNEFELKPTRTARDEDTTMKA